LLTSPQATSLADAQPSSNLRRWSCRSCETHFVNTGDTPLRQIDIHANPQLITEWIDR
jgi:transposase-like protein